MTLQNKKLGLYNNARSPGSIQNAQHHDESGSSKNIAGSPATIESIVADSTTKTPLKPYQILRIVNTTATTKFIFVGKDSDAPVGAPTVSDGLALPPDSVEVLFVGASDDEKDTIVMKTSDSGVQVVLMLC